MRRQGGRQSLENYQVAAVATEYEHHLPANVVLLVVQASDLDDLGRQSGHHGIAALDLLKAREARQDLRQDVGDRLLEVGGDVGAERDLDGNLARRGAADHGGQHEEVFAALGGVLADLPAAGVSDGEAEVWPGVGLEAELGRTKRDQRKQPDKHGDFAANTQHGDLQVCSGVKHGGIGAIL